MIRNDKIIRALAGDNILEKIAQNNDIGIAEAKAVLTNMSFAEYRALAEAPANIIPPSGQSIGNSQIRQTTQPTKPSGPTPPQQAGASKNTVWAGKGSPIQVGMTVGLKGANGVPVPGTISQVDAAAKGVKVKNPTTGQDEWYNNDTLEPFIAQPGQQSQPTQSTEEDTQLSRLQELAGIREECSGGATGVGGIAMAPTSMGSIKKRQPTNEQIPKEYTPKGPAKTIIGDTKPNQATGELSANLAARGKKTASRTNNGIKK